MGCSAGNRFRPSRLPDPYGSKRRYGPHLRLPRWHRWILAERLRFQLSPSTAADHLETPHMSLDCQWPRLRHSLSQAARLFVHSLRGPSSEQFRKAQAHRYEMSRPPQPAPGKHLAEWQLGHRSCRPSSVSSRPFGPRSCASCQWQFGKRARDQPVGWTAHASYGPNSGHFRPPRAHKYVASHWRWRWPLEGLVEQPTGRTQSD